MKRIKSFTRIWKVDKVLYAIEDIKLPVPLTFTQLAWLGASELFVIIFAKVPPFSNMSFIMRNLVVPIAITMLMSKKTHKKITAYRSGNFKN